jgi:hypothetical protein
MFELRVPGVLFRAASVMGGDGTFGIGIGDSLPNTGGDMMPDRDGSGGSSLHTLSLRPLGGEANR